MSLRRLGQREVDAIRSLCAARVRVARDGLGISQRELARVMWRSPSWVREIEGATQWPPAYLLVSLAEATGRSVAWFYGSTS